MSSIGNSKDSTINRDINYSNNYLYRYNIPNILLFILINIRVYKTKCCQFF